MGKVIFFDSIKGEFGGRDPFLNYHTYDWYSVKGYTEIKIYRTFCGERQSNLLEKTQFRDVRHWLENNLEGEVIIKYNDNSGRGSISVSAFFQYESDAIAFKLTWLNKHEYA